MHHSKPIYCVSWNKEDDKVILSTSYDCQAVVFQIDTDSLNDIKTNGYIGSRKTEKKDILHSNIRFKTIHPMPVYGCSWCYPNSNFFSTGCQDGIVRIFDYVVGTQIYRYFHTSYFTILILILLMKVSGS